MKKTLQFCCLALFSTLLHSCTLFEWDPCASRPSLDAEIPFTVSKDTISLQDTIWLNARLVDSNFFNGPLENDKRTFINGQLIGEFYIQRLGKEMKPFTDNNSFEYICEIGKKIDTLNKWEYDYTNGVYSLKIGIIFKEKGNFMIGLLGARGKKEGDKCLQVTAFEHFKRDTLGFGKFKEYNFPTVQTVIRGPLNIATKEYPIVVQ